MYILEKRDSNSDYGKRQILAVQEKFKVFVPALALLLSGLLALNIANVALDFMAVYVCVFIDAIGVGISIGLALSLIKGNTRQRNLFERIAEKAETAATGEESRILRYASDSDGILKRANTVRVTETENNYVILPLLPEYKHKLFTHYDFRGDFGRLILPKDEYTLLEEESNISFVSDKAEFKFTTTGDNVNKRA